MLVVTLTVLPPNCPLLLPLPHGEQRHHYPYFRLALLTDPSMLPPGSRQPTSASAAAARGDTDRAPQQATHCSVVQALNAVLPPRDDEMDVDDKSRVCWCLNQAQPKD